MGAAPWHAARYEEHARQFIAVEIELGLTFTQFAATEYDYRAWDHGDTAKAKAMRACAVAECLLDQAGAHGWDITELRARLRLPREAVAGLERE